MRRSDSLKRRIGIAALGLPLLVGGIVSMTSLHARLGGKPTAARKPAPAASQEPAAAPAAKAAKVQAVASSTQSAEPFKDLWANPARLALMSTASRNALVNKYGGVRLPALQGGAPLAPPVPKPGPTSKGPSARANSLQAVVDSEASSGRTALATVANVAVNAAGSHPVAAAAGADTQATSAIAVVGSNVASAFFDDGGVGETSTFQRTGLARSANGGTSFSQAGSGMVPFSPFTADTGNPVMAKNNATNRVFLVTTAIDTLNFIASQISAFYSDDAGLTYTGPINATPGLPIGDFADKPWVTVDNAAGAGNGNVYMAFRNFSLIVGGVNDGIIFYRSVDGGVNWGPNQGFVIDANPLAQGPQVVVDAAHNVYVFYSDYSSGANGVIKFRRSTDQGVTFEPPVPALNQLALNPANGPRIVLSDNVEAKGYIQAAAHPTIPGVIYVTWTTDAFAAFYGDADTVLAFTLDGGQTWPGFFFVDTSGGYSAWHPALTFSPSGNSLFISWYDSSAEDGEQSFAAGRYMRAGATLGIDGTGAFNLTADLFQISDVLSPKAYAQDPFVAPNFMGDYDQVTADANWFYTTWVDGRAANPNIPTHKRNADIRFGKVPAAGPGGVLRFGGITLNESNGGNGNGVIDPNECFNLQVFLQNNGSDTITGISGTVTTGDPNVITALPGTDTWPDLFESFSVDGTGFFSSANTNATAFEFFTLPTFTCGATVPVTLTVTTANSGTYIFNIKVPTGLAGAPLTFSNALATPVPDGDPVVGAVSTIDTTLAPGPLATGLRNVEVRVYVTHPFPPALVMNLIAPGGEEINLVAIEPGAALPDYGTVCPPDSRIVTAGGATQAAVIAPPRATDYRGNENMLRFRGRVAGNVNGNWQLRVKDVDQVIDAGVLNCWDLLLTPATCAAATCNLHATCSSVQVNPPPPLPAIAPATFQFTGQGLGGVPPYAYSWDFGDGSPIALGQNQTHIFTTVGTFNVNLTVTDSTLAAVNILCTTVTIVCPTITFPATPGPTFSLTTGVPFDSGIILLTNNHPTPNPLVFTVDSGTLPAGINLTQVAPNAFRFIGTPTSTVNTDPVIIRAADSVNPTCFTLSLAPYYTFDVVCATGTIAPPGPFAATTGVPFSQGLTITPGAGWTLPVTWALGAGAPPWLTIAPQGTNSSTMSGTPNVAGPVTYSFDVTATDANGCQIVHPVVINLSCPTIGFNPASGATLTQGTAGVAYGPVNIDITGETSAIVTLATPPFGLPAGLTATLTGAFPNQQIQISGTPTVAGIFSPTFTVTDTFGCSATATYSLTIICPPDAQVNPSALPVTPLVAYVLPGATEGIFYSIPPRVENAVVVDGFTLTGAGPAYVPVPGATPVWSVSAGTLPPGLTLNAATGDLTGIPTDIGDYQFTITASYFGGTCSASQVYTLKVICPTMTISPATLPNGTTGVLYNSGTLTVTGGSSPYLWTISSGSLPPGLAFSVAPPLRSNTNAITGTPTLAGSYTFTVRATDNEVNGECFGQITYTVVISCPAMSFSPAAGSSLPAGTAGVAYSTTIGVNGETGSLSLQSVTNLHTGLSANLTGTFPNQVVSITGTPTVTGTRTITVNLIDVYGCTLSGTFSLTINCPTITVNPASLPAGQTGTSYNQTITQTGGIAPVTFAVSSGSLPTGLTLTSAGVLSGIPANPGTFNFTVTATDANGCTGSRAYSVTVTCGPMTVLPATVPSPVGLQQPYGPVTITVTGGVGITTLAISSGSLPPGLTFNTGTGVISGSPTTAGTFNFTITATSQNGCTGSQAYVIVVDPCINDVVPPVVTPPSPNSITVNQTSCSGGVGGATLAGLQAKFPSQFADLTAYLQASTATDNCVVPTELTSQFGGNDITSSTFFRAGLPANTITFRWRDNKPNIGTATGTVIVLAQGDLDLDGDVDIIDNLIMQAFLVGNANPGTPPFSAPITAADTNGDSVIDIFDVINHQGFIVGNVACLTP